MSEASDEDLARRRWGLINLVRLAGIGMVVVGILGARGIWDLPEAVAWLLLAVGLGGVFVVPRVLARKWRTPRS